MTNTVTLTIEYEAADFVHAARWVIWRSVAPLALGALMLIFSGVIVWLMWSQFGPLFGWAALVAVVIGSALGIPRGIYAMAQQAVKSFETNEAMRHPVTWILTELTIHIQGKGVDAKVELNNFKRAAETKLGFLLWQDKHNFNYLPKRAFSSHEQVKAVRAILRHALPGTAQIDLRDD